MSFDVQRHGSEFVCELTHFPRFRAVFANAVRNLRFGTAYWTLYAMLCENIPRNVLVCEAVAIDAPPQIVLSFQLIEG